MLHDRLWGSNSPQFLPSSGAPLIFGSQRVLDWAYFCRGVVKGSETSFPRNLKQGFYPPLTAAVFSHATSMYELTPWKMRVRPVLTKEDLPDT